MEVRIAGCPLGAKCEEVREISDEQVMFRCPWFVKLRGKDPQSDNEIDEWRCAIAWQPILQIENVQQTRQTGAAVESMRNELVRGQTEFINLIQHRRQKQIEGR